MENRYNDFVFRTDEKTENDTSKNYMNPPMPDGYKHILGEWNDGFVIERISDGSHFVWVPVGSLDKDGTHDGLEFNERFGRRDYGELNFDFCMFNEKFEGELVELNESVEKYGGFYISRFDISKSSEGKPQSVKGVMPWTSINFFDAIKVAASFENRDDVKSCLPYGAVHDSVLAWIIKSGAKGYNQVVKNSESWGNFWYSDNSPKRVVETGSSEDWKANQIYDLAGNIYEMTQERGIDGRYALRGHGCHNIERKYRNTLTAAYCGYVNTRVKFNDTGFRIALYIK